MLLIFHLLLLGQLSPGRCCLCPCLPSRDKPLAERRERKAKGEEEEPSQEAPGPWPSLDPQPRVTEHLSIIAGSSCVNLRVVGVYPLLALSAQSGFRVGVFARE
ncbi:MFS transporter (sodium-dependent inorganic phosphate cotransporter) [Sarotherodon galilaeus]